jgi:hypothetical protein
MAKGEGGGGNFAGTGGYGGNFPGAGGAANNTNSGGYGGTAGWGSVGATAGLTGASKSKSKSKGTTSDKSTGSAKPGATFTKVTPKTTTQTVGFATSNLGEPSPNVEVVDPYSQDTWNSMGKMGIGIPAAPQSGSTGHGKSGYGSNSSISGGGGSGGGAGWASGGVIHPGQHGWVGEHGPEYAFGLPNGGVQITPSHMIDRLVGALMRRY